MQLLSTFIQVTYGAPHPPLPLLFRHMRTGSSLTGQHCLLPNFRSVDAFAVEPSWGTFFLSLDTMLQLPLIELCNQATTDTSFLHHKQIRTKPAHILLKHSRLPDSLVFKARTESSSPGLLSRIVTAVRANTIEFVSSLPPSSLEIL